MKPLTAILLGAGQRGANYAKFALANPDKLKIVGVAEPDATRRGNFAAEHGLADDSCHNTWQEVFAKEKWADCVLICTQDNMHYAPAMAAIDRGYNILLEKPVAPTAAECAEIARAAAEKDIKVVVCHVLRYAPFFAAIKEIVAGGEIGKVVTMVHNENVGHIHHAHSFVRGNWGIEKDSSPMILAKCCHDVDLIQWLLDAKCERLSSFGSLMYFNSGNRPKDAMARCTDGCPVACAYDARRVYLKSDINWLRPTDSEWLRSVVAGRTNPTDEQVENALKTGPYGRCVFTCGNDVVDHQTVSMEFEGGATALLSMSAFTPGIDRSLKIMGTLGEIRGHERPNTIIVTNFDTSISREINLPHEDGHGGGDMRLMSAFCDYAGGQVVPENISEIQISVANHLLCFAAEDSRVNNGKVVEFTAE